jgi:hypothetical protein
MYTEDHDELPHPSPGPGEPEYKHSGTQLAMDSPSIVPSQTALQEGNDAYLQKGKDALTKGALGMFKYFGPYLRKPDTR